MKFISILLLSLSSLIACGEAVPHLEEIRERGELRVLTRYGPTTYYIRDEELAGFEYELAKRFAEHLNVKLKIIVPDNLGDILKLIEQGKADIAAAGLTVTPDRQDIIRFGPVYEKVIQQLVYRLDTKKPNDLTDLEDGQLEVVAASSHAELLQSLKEEIPSLTWTENSELDSSGLLELVQRELIDYTIADSNEVAANQLKFPELRVAFNITNPQPIAWAMPFSEDESLAKEMASFFDKIDESGDLTRLKEKYYGHIRHFDYLDTRAIERRIQTHLPKYQELFEQAGQEHDIDWRILAAMAYQESHWDPHAVSPTGVRGLMMLTQSTAKLMKVTDRKDPVQSIKGGAAYLASIKKRIPERIQEPDRTWMALAAYNVGLGHLEDARKLTQANGGNPDLWPDVKAHLPWLSKRKWYEQTKHGYARGGEPVHYVQNIRRYYDILLQFTAKTEQANTPEKQDTLPGAL